MENSVAFQKLTTTITKIGRIRNKASTTVSGLASSQPVRWFDFSKRFIGTPARKTGARTGPRRFDALSGDELVPFADHILVFIHNGVPAGHFAHPVIKRPAIAQIASPCQLLPGG